MTAALLFVRTVPRRIFFLVFLVFLVSSVAISTTGILLFSSSGVLASAAGTGRDAILVYSSTSRVPETSDIPLSIGRNISSMPGVLSVLPEVTTPVAVGGKADFLRGTNLSAFASVERVELQSGSWPGSEDNHTVVLGSNLASSLRVSPGQQLSVFSFFKNQSYSLTVGGVLRSGAPFDDELLTPLALAQRLRGFDANTVTMLSLQVDPTRLNSEALKVEVESLKTGPSSSSPVDLAILPVSSFAGVSPSSVIDQVLGRSIGLSESVFWVMIAVVAAASLLLVFFGLSWSVQEYSRVLSILNDIGLTRERIAVRLGTAFSTVGVLAGLVGYLLAYASLSELASIFSVHAFFHALVIGQSPQLALFSLLFPVAATVVVIPFVVIKGSRRRRP